MIKYWTENKWKKNQSSTLLNSQPTKNNISPKTLPKKRKQNQQTKNKQNNFRSLSWVDLFICYIHWTKAQSSKFDFCNTLLWFLAIIHWNKHYCSSITVQLTGPSWQMRRRKRRDDVTEYKKWGIIAWIQLFPKSLSPGTWCTVAVKMKQ